MKYSKLQEFVDKKEWRNARYELENIQKQIVECDDVLAILASVIFLEEGNQEEAYRYISKGISYNCKNYELYFLLGNYYEHKNINQAWLCYENAEFYCDNVQDLGIIRQYKKRIERMEGWDVKKTSIVILSYNLKDICQQCIESIRKNNSPSSYETPLYNFLKEMPYEALWCIISLRTKIHERRDLIRPPYYTTTNT